MLVFLIMVMLANVESSPMEVTVHMLFTYDQPHPNCHQGKCTCHALTHKFLNVAHFLHIKPCISRIFFRYKQIAVFLFKLVQGAAHFIRYMSP